MKSIARTLVFGLLAAATAGISQAAPLKIGIVDMSKVYTQYYRTRIQEAELEKHKKAAREEIEKMMKTFNGLREQLKVKVEALRGTAEGSAARTKAEDAYKATESEAQSLARDIDEFGRRRQKMLGDKLKRMQEEIIAELQDYVGKCSANYDLVFDKTGISSSGVAVMIFSKDAIDFTDDVVKKVNENAPADTPAAPAQPPEATAPVDEPGAATAPVEGAKPAAEGAKPEPSVVPK